MFKFFLACLIILIFNSPSKSQTYIYDPNLKIKTNLFYELFLVSENDNYTPEDIKSEYALNEIRAAKKFKNKPFVLQGRISAIKKTGKYPVIVFDISDNSFIKRYFFAYVMEGPFKIQNRTHYFDSLDNYSTGDWIYMVGGMVGGQFAGSILHTNQIISRPSNYLVKITNIPEETEISFENQSENAKFKPIVNGKTYLKFFETAGRISINLTFKDKHGFIVKECKISTKQNCHSIFDYNKL